MKTYWDIKEEYLVEGKVPVTKVKAGMKVEVQVKGPIAKRVGYKKGANPFGDGVKVQILGYGLVPYGKRPEKKHVITKSIADFKTKYKQQIKDLKAQDDYNYERGLSMYNANGKLRIMTNDLTDTVLKKYKPGFPSYIVQVLDGAKKGDLDYLYISSAYDDRWCIHLGDDVEFDLFT